MKFQSEDIKNQTTENISDMTTDNSDANGTVTEKKLSFFDRIDNYFSKYNYSYLIWAFLIPAVIMLLIYIRKNVYPFGESSVLVLDLNGQYVQFFAALRAALHGDASLLYSFGRSLGGEFLGIYAYYLASPFSFIVALFPEKNILEALLTIFVLKCGSAGLTFGIFMHNSQRCNKTLTVALSTLYALCAYSVVMQHNTMWIDGLIILPLLALGVERIIKYKKPLLYVISLAITLIANYYIGYMSCIFIILYFFYYYFSNYGHTGNPLNEKHHFWCSFLRMGVYSVLGIAISSIMLIPAYYSLTFGKTEFTDPEFSFVPKDINILDFITKLFPGAYDTVYPNGLPWMYCGILALVVLPLFFLAKKIKWQEKVCTASFLVIMVISMYIPAIDMAWHGFQAPNWLNYRYSFMLSFLLLVIAGKAITLIREIGYKAVIVSSGLLTVIVIVLQAVDPKYEKHTGEMVSFFDDINGVWLSIICIVAYASVLCVMSKHKAYSEKIDNLALIMAFVICAETFLTGVHFTTRLNEDVVISSYDSYHDVYDTHMPAVDYVKENSEYKFYRFEKTFTRNVTDSFVFNVNGVASSTSTLYADVINLLKNLGMKADSHWTEYGGSTPVTDSLFGIRYLMAAHKDGSLYYGTPLYQYQQLLLDNTKVAEDLDEKEIYNSYFDEKYQLYFENDDTLVYENPYALSLAFSSSSKINEVSLDAFNNPFDRMNAIMSAVASNEKSIYSPLEYTLWANNEEVNKTDYMFDSGKISGSFEIVPHGDHFWIVSSSEYAFVEFKLRAAADGNIYAYFPSVYPRHCEVAVSKEGIVSPDNTSIIGVYTIYDGNANIAPIINLGYFNEGDEISVKLNLKYKNDYNSTFINKLEYLMLKDANCFYYIDDEVFDNVFTSLSKNQLIINDFDNDFIKGKITVKEEETTVMTTIPYDKGWSLKVNGKPAETYSTLTCMMAFDLPAAGTYIIEMKYFPSIYFVGIILSLIASLILCVGAAFVYLSNKNKISIKTNTHFFNIANIFVPLSCDVIYEEFSLIELEELEEKEELLEKKLAKKKKRKNKK